MAIDWPRKCAVFGIGPEKTVTDRLPVSGRIRRRAQEDLSYYGQNKTQNPHHPPFPQQVIYSKAGSPEAVAELIKDHLAPGEAEQGRNGGVHMAYLENFLKRTGTGFLVGNRLSIADAQLYFLLGRFVDRPLWAEFKLKEVYPNLGKHWDMMKGNKELNEYITSSPFRFEQINGVKIG